MLLIKHIYNKKHPSLTNINYEYLLLLSKFLLMLRAPSKVEKISKLKLFKKILNLKLTYLHIPVQICCATVATVPISVDLSVSTFGKYSTFNEYSDFKIYSHLKSVAQLFLNVSLSQQGTYSPFFFFSN